MNDIAAEKIAQAVDVLTELDLDCWLTFVRETTETGDPILPIILGQPLTWQSALLVTKEGERIAIVGKYEDQAVRSTGVWEAIVPYVEGVSGPLRETLQRIDPKSIAVNFSLNDVKADGLSHGMYELLRRHLGGTPYADRLVSAEAVIRAVRGRKTTTEVGRMKSAIATTEAIFEQAASFARPGTSEAEIAAFMHQQAAQRGLGLAWEAAMCPIVTTGPDSMVGHGLPSPTLTVTPGCIFHLDFGVRQNDYCSDMQRAWYVPSEDEPEPPEAVRKACDAIVSAIQAAKDVLKPGAEGWQVDAAARSALVNAGYPEYQHATGHHIGRAAHDGAGVLGPKWERYGQTPMYPAEPGNVFTLELGVENVDGRGYLGLEEMVLVTDDGCQWLTEPQRELRILS